MLMSLGLKDIQVWYTTWRMISVLLLMLIHMQPPPVKAIPRGAANTDSGTGLRTVSKGAYSYTITTDDLQREQRAIEPGEGVRTYENAPISRVWLWVGSRSVLLTIYGFVPKPVCRYSENSNTSIPKLQLYQSILHTVLCMSTYYMWWLETKNLLQKQRLIC